MEKIKWKEELFLLTIGTLFMWSLYLAVIASTMVIFDPWAALVQAFVVLFALRLVFLNKYTLLFVIAVILVAALILTLDVAIFTPRANQNALIPRPTALENMMQPLVSTVRYIEGFYAFDMTHNNTISWFVMIALGVFVAVFGFLSFNFFALAITSVIIFAIALNSGFFFHNFSFYVFIFCIAAYLIKFLNARSLGGNRKASFSPFSLYAMPIASVCLIVALILPTPAPGYAAGFRDNFITRPFTAVVEMLEDAFHPRYFSLAQTGFGGGDARQLGGDARPNYSLAMRVTAPEGGMPIYLAGARFDEYTGRAWINNYRNDPPALDLSTTGGNLDVFELLTSGMTLWLADNYIEFFEAWQHVQNSPNRRYSDFVEIIRPVLNDEELQELEEDIRQLLMEMLELDLSEEAMEYANVANIPRNEHEMQERFYELVTLAIEVAAHVAVANYQPYDFEQLETANVTWAQFSTWVFDEMWGLGSSVNSFFPSRAMQSSAQLSIDTSSQNITQEHIFRSYNAFTVGFLEAITSPSPEIGFTRDAHSTVLADTLMRRDDRIDVRFVEPARTVDTQALAAASYQGVLYDAYRAAILAGFDQSYFHNLINISYIELLREYLIPRAQWIYETYTGLPEELPSRVHDLAVEVTRAAQNNFDRAFLLNEFLQTSFPYTLTPGNTPADEDFVDWFLFEQRQGYCVHFATSFVVMARSLGLAARYVEGFYVTGNPGTDGFVNVINRQGHAWAEVYFEGFGWKIFEPTPAGAVHMHSPRAETFRPPHLDFYDPTAEQDLWDDLYDTAATTPANDFESDDDQHDTAAVAVEPIEPMSFGQVAMLSLFFAGGLAFVIIMTRVLLGALRDAKIRKMSPNNAAIAYFAKMTKYLEGFGHNQGALTPLAYAKLANQHYTIFDEALTVENAASTFYKARYSTHLVSKDEIEIIEQMIKKMDVRLKDRLGFWQFVIQKYIKVAFS